MTATWLLPESRWSDLFDGLRQLANLLTTSVNQYAETDALQVGRLEHRLGEPACDDAVRPAGRRRDALGNETTGAPVS